MSASARLESVSLDLLVERWIGLTVGEGSWFWSECTSGKKTEEEAVGRIGGTMCSADLSLATLPSVLVFSL